MTETTFNPDNSSEDGEVGRSIANQTYAQMHDGVGNNRNDSADTANINASQDYANSERWDNWHRGIFMFNTSSIDDSAIISEAKLGLVMVFTDNDFTGGDYGAVVSVDPAYLTSIDSNDWSAFGTTIFAPNITISSMTVDSSTFTEWTLNATGIAAIDKTGVTKLGVRVGADLDNDDDLDSQWVLHAQNSSILRVATSEEALTGDKRPRLVVTYTVPTFTPRAIIF